MSLEEILLAIVKYSPAEIELIEDGIRAIRGAMQDGQTEAEAVQTARDLSRKIVDAMAGGS